MSGSTIADRRQAVRRSPREGEPIARIRLRTGREVIVLDVSDAGALVEGEARLLPGTHVDAHVVTAAGRLLVRSRVVRACVSSLATGLVYRTALSFQRAIDSSSPGYGFPATSRSAPEIEGNAYPRRRAATELPQPDRLSA